MVRTFMIGLLALCPVAAHAAPSVQTCDANWIDHGRADRNIPVRIRVPAGTGRAPVILFSHGLGGSLDSGTDWVSAWADAGFITVSIQHAGSDSAIREGQSHPLLAMLNGMSPEQLRARAGDVHFVLDRIAKGGQVGACNLARVDMSEVGMSGHSLGARTALAVSGGVYADTEPMRDPRIKAAIAFSPQPAPGEDDHAAFGAITIPFFTVTGTQDSLARFNGTTAQDRLRPYQAMPAGQKYLLVVNGANHLMLNGQTLPKPSMTPTPEMVDEIRRATTLFWRATLNDDQTASVRLRDFGAHPAPGDRFAEK